MGRNESLSEESVWKVARLNKMFLKKASVKLMFDHAFH